MQAEESERAGKGNIKCHKGMGVDQGTTEVDARGCRCVRMGLRVCVARSLLSSGDDEHTR